MIIPFSDGFAGSRRQRAGVHLVDRVGRSIHVEVEPEVEEVLVMRRDDVGRHEMRRTCSVRRGRSLSCSRTPFGSMMPVSAASSSSTPSWWKIQLIA